MNHKKGFAHIPLIIGVVLLIGIAGYFAISRQTPSQDPVPTPDPETCDVNPDKNGRCPDGCVNYGVPLGCVTEEYFEKCQTGDTPCPL